MSKIKRYIKSKYIMFRDAKFWKNNNITRSCRKMLLRSVGFVFYVKHIVGHTKRLIMHQIYKIRFIKRIRKNLNRKGIHLQLARNFAKKGKWESSRKYYSKLHHRFKDTPRELELFNETRMNISLLDRIIDIKNYKKQIERYKKLNKKIKPKTAIVVAISGGYDTVKLPAVLNPEYDYILYTNTPMLDVGVYKIRPMPFFHQDTTRIARFVKTNLSTLLPEYETVVWVDANLMMMDDISPLLEDFRKSQKAVGAIPHPLRKSVYEEGEACKKHNKEDNRQIDKQMQRLKREKYSTNELIESNFMMFDMTNKKTHGFFKTWWKELDTYTRRDQLSLNYSLDKNGINYHRIMKRPTNSRSHELFSIISHSMPQTTPDALQNALGAKVVDPYKAKAFSSIKPSVVKKHQDKKIDIVYCVHNALEDVKKCLSSVKKHHKSPNVNLIIIDDGSDRPTQEFLEKFHHANKKWTELHRKESGSGYTRAANRGLRASKGDLMILLNSDTIVTDGWTEKMADAVFTSPGTGIVGPMSSAASHQSIPNHKSSNNQTAVNDLPQGISVDDMNEYCEKWSGAGHYPLVPLAHGFCLGIRREVIDSIGLFDEEAFPKGYGEENDYCFRATNAGFKLVIATNTYIYHAKSKSYQSEARIQFMQDGNNKLRDMHGKQRIWRAVVTMQENPSLVAIREKTKELFKQA